MEELKTCHQCRERTKNRPMVVCKNLKERKPCTLKFCWRCLLNRYGEQGEEVEKLNDWKCPKCRNNCNCSVCLKRKGNEPLGKLTKTIRHESNSSGLDLNSVNPEEFPKSTGSGHDATPTTLEVEIPIPSRTQETSSNKVLKKKKETKRKKVKWSSRFKSLRRFVDKENETSTEEMEEETFNSDKDE